MLFSRPLRIVIPGGSGHVGRLLSHYFQERGHHVTVLTRSPFAASWNTVHWDGEHPGTWTQQLEGADVCINLAGRTMSCRHTAANRQASYQSRIDTTQLLGDVIATLSDPPQVWLNASTATIYRDFDERDRGSMERNMDEYTGDIGGLERPAAALPASESSSFPARVAFEWEAALFAAFTPRTRKVALRSAIVMNPTAGGAFSMFVNLIRFSLGGTQGSGLQYVSWIHGTDFARAVEFLIAQNDLDGVVNFAAPTPLPNREFMATLREAYGMPNGLPLPTPLLRLICPLLRTEPDLLLKSRRVIPARLLRAGFEFLYPTWQEAAEDLVRQWRDRP